MYLIYYVSRHVRAQFFLWMFLLCAGWRGRERRKREGQERRRRQEEEKVIHHCCVPLFYLLSVRTRCCCRRAFPPRCLCFCVVWVNICRHPRSKFVIVLRPGLKLQDMMSDEGLNNSAHIFQVLSSIRTVSRTTRDWNRSSTHLLQVVCDSD